MWAFKGPNSALETAALPWVWRLTTKKRRHFYPSTALHARTKAVLRCRIVKIHKLLQANRLAPDTFMNLRQISSAFE
jgi:hypothetical protein